MLTRWFSWGYSNHVESYSLGALDDDGAAFSFKAQTAEISFRSSRGPGFWDVLGEMWSLGCGNLT